MALRPLPNECIESQAVVNATTSDGQQVRAGLTVHFGTARDVARASTTAAHVVELLRTSIENATLAELTDAARALEAVSLERARDLDAAIVRLELGPLQATAALESSVRRKQQPASKVHDAPTERPPAPADARAGIVWPLVRQAANQLTGRVTTMLFDGGDRRSELVAIELEVFTAFGLYDELVRAGFAPHVAARWLEAVATDAFSHGRLLGIARYLHPVHASPELELLSRLGAICDVDDAHDLILALLAVHRAELRVAAGLARGAARAP